MSSWICADEIPRETRFYYFEKSFNAQKGASLSARVCADTRYILYLNGHAVSEGPCQGSEYVRYYETVDLTPFLKEGENKLCAKVLFAHTNVFISMYRYIRPALWFDGILKENGEEKRLSSDASWTCMRDDSVRFHWYPGMMNSMPPYEEILGERKLTQLNVLQMYEPHMDKSECYSPYGLRDVYPLVPRPIPQMREYAPESFKIVRRGDGYIEFDAGEYTTAKINMTIKAPAGATVKLLYSECYTVEDENGNRYKAERDNSTHPTSKLEGFSDIIHATGKEQHFSSFALRPFRFIRVEYPADLGDIDIVDFTYSKYFYPMDDVSEFKCSDESYNRMWEISRNTVLCCMHEIYVDCPFYEQQQYDMDSLLEILFTFRMTSDSRLPLKCVTDLAHSQMHDGMLQANYPSTSVQIIPGFTLFWVMMLREYVRYKGADDETLQVVKSFIGTVDKALGGFDARLDERGLISPSPYWHFVDWVPGWERGVPPGGEQEPITVTCLMYSKALSDAAELAELIGRPNLAIDYRERADRMNRNVKRHCFDPVVGLYKNTPSRQEYSEHTALWAILSDAVGYDTGREMIEKIFSGKVTDSEGNKINISKCSFSMGHFMFRAIEKVGKYEYADKLFDGWRKMMSLNCTTWCENPDSPRSECHGWSSAPIYELSSVILGVYPTQAGYREVTVKPYIHHPGITYASGKVPTPYGEFAVSWKVEGDSFKMDVAMPQGSLDLASLTVVLPSGETLNIKDESVHLESTIRRDK